MSFLQKVGNVLRTILHIGEEAATIATPFITLAFPQVAPLYSTTLGLAVGMEATIGSASGTGAQKLAALVPALLPQAKAWAAQNGIAWSDADIQKWASAVVDTINLIPAPVDGVKAVPSTPAATA